MKTLLTQAKKTQTTERETVLQAMMQYVDGKEHKQIASRGFLAGVNFYKKYLLTKTNN